MFGFLCMDYSIHILGSYGCKVVAWRSKTEVGNWTHDNTQAVIRPPKLVMDCNGNGHVKETMVRRLIYYPYMLGGGQILENGSHFWKRNLVNPSARLMDLILHTALARAKRLKPLCMIIIYNQWNPFYYQLQKVGSLSKNLQKAKFHGHGMKQHFFLLLFITCLSQSN